MDGALESDTLAAHGDPQCPAHQCFRSPGGVRQRLLLGHSRFTPKLEAASRKYVWV
jgi:hypothetical protein